ncbi:MAG: glycosyltransferase family 2 protein [Thermofilum sp.]|nr:glycosyltransferase family 2 protein [Thermofilum sp.]
MCSSGCADGLGGGEAELPAVSVIIPAYRGGRELVELVERLLGDSYPRKEVIVAVDEPLPDVAEALEKLGCKLVVSNERRGKVHALNEAVKLSSGEVLVFLDDDVAVEDECFLGKIVEAMRGYDVADVKKVIAGRSLLARLVRIEYVAVNFASMLLARLSGYTVAFNGAAFAIRREALESLGGFPATLTEDFDLGLKCFLHRLRYTFVDSTYVLNYPPASWSEWYRQRKRWAIGVSDWLRRNYRVLLKAVAEMPHVLLPGLVLLLPSLITFAMTLILYNLDRFKAAALLLIGLSSLVSQLLPVATLLTLHIQLAYLLTAAPLLATLLVFTTWHIAASKKLSMRSEAYLYPLYLFFYQVLWLVVLLAGLVRVLVLRRTDVEDWVV